MAMNYRNVLPYHTIHTASTMTGSLNVHKRLSNWVLAVLLYMVLCEAQHFLTTGFSSAQTVKANRMTRRLCGKSKNQGG